MVFERVLPPNMHAESEILKCIKSQQNTVNNGTEATSAFTASDKNQAKIHPKSRVFWDLDFESILGGFWGGLGTLKSMIFGVFSSKNGSKKQEDFWKAKNSHFRASRANCGRSAAVRAGPGEGIKGWGKALGSGILGFAF